jgi:hypothetical protein
VMKAKGEETKKLGGAEIATMLGLAVGTALGT